MSLAVTGATGNLGGLVIDHLIERGTPADQVVALVRDVAKAADLVERGVEVRTFDYDRPATSALAGVDSLLLVSGTDLGRRQAQHRAVIDAAAAAGVGRVVYTSAPHAEASINPVAPDHKATEEYLAASGLGHVNLRNGWYHENFLGDLAAARQTGQVLTAAGHGRVASASRSDLADAAAVVLAGSETDRTYKLTGDEAWRFDDLAADLAEVLHREVVAAHVSPAEKSEALEGMGLDAGLVGFLVGVDEAIAAGELGDTSGELAGLIGRPTSPIIDTLRTVQG
ncbi:NAD(P)H dehydrogenase (quinone) [Raineyella antarctica]|uniref:NAD(P)H dehydrogenase (Quinone) n=1 Tax=Raineyella antarctica TaxID=1577474 RepID=A0A1G6GKV3_9ACTN|nr:NAD(P)H-binding protein [Raineyella antarctica]SDB82662.1 NAD(P)H dehydrogenase (quinone) [Raineyella antarctica]